MIPVACPRCGARLRVPEAAAGRTAKCGKCGGRLTIPPQPAPVLAQPPAPSFEFAPPDEDIARPPRRRGGNGVGAATWIALGAVLLLGLLVTAGGWFIYQTMNRGAIIIIRPPAEASPPEPEPVKVNAQQTPGRPPPFVGTWNTAGGGGMAFKPDGLYELVIEGKVTRAYWKARDPGHIEIREHREEKENDEAMILEYVMRSADVMATRVRPQDELHEMRRVKP